MTAAETVERPCPMPAPAVIALVLERAGERDDALELYRRACLIDPAITLDELVVAVRIAGSLMHANPPLSGWRH